MRLAGLLAFSVAGALIAPLGCPRRGGPAGGLPDAASGQASSPADPPVVRDEACPAPGPQGPALPRVYLDTAGVTPSGRVNTVPADSRIQGGLNAMLRILRLPAGGRLQAALDTARPGDVIELAAGSTYVGNFMLPNKPGAQWIVIRSSAYDRLPPSSVRVSPALADLMPKIVSPNKDPAISTAAGAHHYRFIGIEVATTSPFSVNLIRLEAPGGNTSSSQVPTQIVIDRCYIHGTPTGNIRNGVLLNSAYTAVIDSYISEIHEVDSESHGILGQNGPGPFKIANNEIQAAGINVMFTEQPRITNLVPSDIEVRGNYFTKRLSWRPGDPSYAGIPWAVKNLFELKNAARVLIDGNVFENNWVGVFQPQDGFAVAFSVAAGGPNTPWVVVKDVTFTHNIVQHSSAGIQFRGNDVNYPAQTLQRILIRDNLFVDIGAFPMIYNAGRLFQISDGGADYTFDHNTAFHIEDPLYAQTHAQGYWPATGFSFTNNIAANNAGVCGDATGCNVLSTLPPPPALSRPPPAPGGLRTRDGRGPLCPPLPAHKLGGGPSPRLTPHPPPFHHRPRGPVRPPRGAQPVRRRAV